MRCDQLALTWREGTEHGSNSIVFPAIATVNSQQTVPNENQFSTRENSDISDAVKFSETVVTSLFMSTQTVDSLLASLQTSRLLTSDQLESVRAESARATSADDLGRSLVERGWITAWQRTQLKRGHTVFYLENDRYLLCDQIGQGGMGAVYKARHTRMNRVVAIKVIDPRKNTHKRLIDRFKREVDVSSRLQHEHIVRALDVGQHADVTFLVLEFVEGSDLTDLVKRDGPMSADEAAAICLQAASGLAYAHTQNIIHRDIKPRNILLSTTGSTKILDMGLARIVEDNADADQTGLTGDGDIMGTVDYMAPEQARDSHAADARCDIYSLGATLYFLVSGQPPFPGGTTIEKLHRLAVEAPQPLGQLRPDCPKALADIVDKMMAGNPRERFQTAEEVVRALKPLAAENIAGRPVQTAGVQTAAETHRNAAYEETVDIGASFEFDALEQPSLTAMGRRRKSNTTTWIVIGTALCLAIGIGLAAWQLVGSGAKGPNEESKTKSVAAVPVNAKPPAGVRVEFSGHFGMVWSVAWSPNGQYIATGGGDGQVRIWDAAEQKTLTTYRGHHSCVYALAWSADSRLIASGDVYGEVHVWRVLNGTRIQSTQRSITGNGKNGGIVSEGKPGMAFSPDGKEIAYAEEPPRRVVRWSIPENKIIWSEEQTAYLVRYSPDGKKLVTAGFDGQLSVWDLESNTKLLNLAEDKLIKIPAFLSDESLAVSSMGKVEIWNLKTKTIERKYRPRIASNDDFGFTKINSAKLPNMQFSASAQSVSILTVQGTKILNLETGDVTSQPATVEENVQRWAFSPNLGQLAHGDPHYLRLTRTAVGDQIGRLGTAHMTTGFFHPKTTGQRFLQGW